MNNQNCVNNNSNDYYKNISIKTMFVIKNEHGRYKFETLGAAVFCAIRHNVPRVFWCNEHIINGRYAGDILLHGSIEELKEKALSRDYFWYDIFGGYEPPIIAEKDYLGED